MADDPAQTLKQEYKDGLWESYSSLPSSELLQIYESQQEELVELSKQLEDFTRKNIELSMSNLHQLQSLQNTNAPFMSGMSMQPPRLSQLSRSVRQQSWLEQSSLLGVARGASEHLTPNDYPDSFSAPEAENDDSAPEGVCTQEDAAAILMQMSRRMSDEEG